jgi:hypothetical protein
MQIIHSGVASRTQPGRPDKQQNDGYRAPYLGRPPPSVTGTQGSLTPSGVQRRACRRQREHRGGAQRIGKRARTLALSVALMAKDVVLMAARRGYSVAFRARLRTPAVALDVHVEGDAVVGVAGHAGHVSGVELPGEQRGSTENMPQ